MNWMKPRGVEPPAVASEPVPTLEVSPSVDFPSLGIGDARRGQAVALLGLPDSAKTSFLYALKHAPLRTDGLRWSWPPSSRPLAASTGKAGEPLRATAEEEFRVARFGTLHRRWWKDAVRRGMEWFAPSRPVTICEIAGENVIKFASGEISQNPQIRSVLADLENYLGNCDEVLFLSGIVATEAIHAKRPLTQEQLDNVLANAATDLRHVVGHMRGTRKPGDAIFATFLITKRDALRGFPSLDAVRVDAAGSALRAATESSVSAQADAVRALLQKSAQGGGAITFSLNDVCDAAGADIALHEAATADFLRCHAPTAASALADLAKQPRVSLRVLTCKPFGREFRTIDGSRAFPDVNQMDISMVWETLDDLVERSFSWRRQSRLQLAGVLAAAMIVGAFLTGPVLSSCTRRTADSAIEAYRSKSATAPRVEVGDSLDAFDPWGATLRSFSDGWAMDDALRWKRFRDAVAEHHDGDSKSLKLLDDEIESRDPDGSLATTDVRKRNRQLIRDFLLLKAGEAELLPVLTTRAHLRLQVSDAEYVRKVVRDIRLDPPDSISGSKWKDVAKNLSTLESWIGTGVEQGKPAIVVADASVTLPGLRSEIARSRAVADLRADLAAFKVTASLPGDLSAMRKMLGRALAADDLHSVERIDRVLGDLLSDAWKAQVPPPSMSAPKVPEIAAAAGKSGEFGWAYAEESWRTLATNSVDSWLGSMQPWLADGDVSLEQQAEFLSKSSDQLARCVKVLHAPAGSGLAQASDAIALLSRRAKAIGAVDASDAGTHVDAVVRDVRAAFVDGQAGSVPGRVSFAADQALDCGPFAERQREALRAKLAALALVRATAAVSAPSEGSAQQLQSIIELASAVKGKERIATWVLKVDPLIRSLAAASAPSAGDMSAIEAICSDADAAKLLPTLLPSIGRWPGTDAHKAIEATLVAIQKSRQLKQDAKAECTKVLFASVADWSAIAPPASLKADLDKILQCAKKNGFDASGFCLGSFRKQFASLLEPTGAGVATGSAVGTLPLWQDLFATSTGSSDVDVTKEVFAGQLAELAAEVSTSAEVGRREQLLSALAEKSDDARFHALRQTMDELSAFRKSVADAKLQPFFDGNAIVLYIGREEFCRKDLPGAGADIDRTCPPDAEAPLAPGTPEVATLAQAQCIAAALKLRLPTCAEWLQVRKSAADGGDVANLCNAGLKAWASKNRAQYRSSDLARNGDTAGSAQYPVTGLIFGRREWCSDAQTPQGSSNKFPGLAPGKNVSDCGFRLAADPLPVSLARWNSAKQP